MKKIIPIIFLGLILVAGFIIAVPGLPHIFSGKVSGAEVPAGIEITATVGSEPVGVVGHVEQNNEYSAVQVFPQASSGKIQFFVGGVKTKKTIDYTPNKIEENFELELEYVPETWASCGDTVRNGGEQCDANDFGEGFPTCESIKLLYYGQSGYTEGMLKCYDSNSSNPCTYDVSNCKQPAPVNNNNNNPGSNNNPGGGGGGPSISKKTTSSNNLATLSTNGTIVGENETIDLNGTENSDAESKRGITGLAVGDFVKSTGGKISIGVLGVLALIILILIFVSIKKNKKEMKIVKLSEMKNKK
jgi:hypothetical protein